MYKPGLSQKKLLAAILLLATLLTSFMGFTESLAAGGREPKPEPPDSDVIVLRSAYSKTYILPDNTYETVVSAEPVHYQAADGYFKDIENTIVDETKTLKNTSYKHRNAANAYTARFGDMSGDLPVLMEYGGNSVGFRPVGARDAAAQKGRATNALKSVVPDENAVTYYDVYPGVDMVYESAISGLKEYIVLKEPGTPNDFEFELELNGLRIQNEAGIIKLEDETGTELLELSGLMAFDANGEATDKVGCEVMESEGTYRLCVTLDEEYLAAKERAYPVVIDPSVMITGSNSTFDTFVSSAKPNTNYYMNNYLRLGYDSTYGKQWMLIKFNLPTNIRDTNVTSAKLRVKKYSGTNTSLKAYRITSDWTPKTATWNKKPTMQSTTTMMTPVSDGGAWYYYSATAQVKRWLNGSDKNYGLGIKTTSETGSTVVYYSSDAPSPNKPELIINHTTNVYNGCRPYFPCPKGDHYNCFGYAVNYKKFIGAKEMGLQPFEVDGKNIDQLLQVIKEHSEAYMRKKGIKYRQMSSCDSYINQNEYLVVMRAAFYDREGPNGIPKKDGLVRCTDFTYLDSEIDECPTYHWWYRTTDGTWAEKKGGNAANLIPGIVNPKDGKWFGADATKSKLVYYAITYSKAM